MPQRVTDIRVLIAELQRINSHLVWLGTHGLEVGAVSVMLYCFRERELLLNINEMLAGFRMFPSYIRIGGLREDLPAGFHDAVRAFLDRLPGKLDEYEGLLTQNQIWVKRTKGVGRIFGGGRGRLWPGRPDRACGRRRPTTFARRFPTWVTRRTTFDVPLALERRRVRPISRPDGGDAAERPDRAAGARAHLAHRPVQYPGLSHVPPPKDRVYTEMEALIQHFLIYSQGFTTPVG